MISNSNYSIGLQCLKPVHTAYGTICMSTRKLLMHWHVVLGTSPRDVNGRDRGETETSASRDRDVDNFSPDETETLVRLETVLRPRRQDRDHNPGDWFCSS